MRVIAHLIHALHDDESAWVIISQRVPAGRTTEGQLHILSLKGHSQAFNGAGQREILAVAKAMARLPQRVIWKMGDKEVAQAGGLSALNLTANIKVRPLTRSTACRLHHGALHRAQEMVLHDISSNRQECHE